MENPANWSFLFTRSLVLVTLNVSVRRVCLASPEKCSHSLGLTRGKEREGWSINY